MQHDNGTMEEARNKFRETYGGLFTEDPDILYGMELFWEVQIEKQIAFAEKRKVEEVREVCCNACKEKVSLGNAKGLQKR